MKIYVVMIVFLLFSDQTFFGGREGNCLGWGGGGGSVEESQSTQHFAMVHSGVTWHC